MECFLLWHLYRSLYCSPSLEERNITWLACTLCFRHGYRKYKLKIEIAVYSCAMAWKSYDYHLHFMKICSLSKLDHGTQFKQNCHYFNDLLDWRLFRLQVLMTLAYIDEGEHRSMCVEIRINFLANQRNNYNFETNLENLSYIIRA